MFGGGNANSDKALQKLVDRRLQRSGGASGLKAVVMRGSVTLTGKLKYESQRMPLMKALGSVAGVRSVLDQLTAPPKKMPPKPGQAGG